MRVNVDSMALADPRFKRLAGRLKITWHEALGRCVPVWMHAYEKRGALMAVQDVDALSELAGLADAMVAVALADQSGPDHVRLRGVTERIEFLLEQDRKRGLAQAARKSKSESRRTSPGKSSGDAPRHGPYSPTPDHDQTPEPLRPRGKSPGNIPREASEASERSAVLREVLRQHAGDDNDVSELATALAATGTAS